MIDTRRQFRILYRDSLVRLIDLELLSAAGDATRLFGQFAALLAACSFVLAIYLVPRYAFARMSPQSLALAATGDQEFLISTTMAVVGMFAVIAWNAVFPDRRDLDILGPLPVSSWTLFEARAAAIATGLAISIAAVNIFTGVSYPFAIPGVGLVGALRTFAAYWITMAAAGLFVFSTVLAAQGLAAQLLSYQLFLRVSNFLQVAIFFLVLALYFLTPSSSEIPITAKVWIGWFPSYWFTGVFQELNGAVHPVFAPLARRALLALSVAVGTAMSTYALAYFRTMRRMAEQPDIVTVDRSRAGRWSVLLSKLVTRPLDRAIVAFTARTLARSRQHRTMLAAYVGIGLAISLSYAKILLYGNSQVYASMRSRITVPHWYEPNVPLMAVGSVMFFFTVAGTRAVFSLPAALKANWIFQITQIQSDKKYFAAVRKSLYIVAATPVWIVAAGVYLSIWPAAPAVAHLIAIALAGVVLVERSLYEFRKIPFTCSYLPGKSDLTRKLAVWGILFLALTEIGTLVEYSSMQSTSRYIVFSTILLALAVRARSRWAAFAAQPHHRVQFDEIQESDVSPLDLRSDGVYTQPFEFQPERPWRARLKSAALRTAAVTIAVACIGAAYEQYGQWQHRRDFPRIGRAVNIGGRSLNTFCSGNGGPTVIFESGAGGPGLSWVLIQREVAKFTRACWYDRAGYGWSDPGPYPRDSAAAARDLHALLQGAAIEAPYILVGASFGGFHVRVYNAMYPGETAGIVLVDSSHVDERDRIVEPPALVELGQTMLAQTLRAVGLLRVFMDAPSGTPPRGVSAEEWRTINSFEPKTLAENAKELFARSAKEARAARGLSGVPLIVLTAGLPSGEAHNPVEARQKIAHQKHWIAIQEQLARQSSLGKQIVIQNSRHGIQFDAPEAVIAAVREMVFRVRATGSSGGSDPPRRPSSRRADSTCAPVPGFRIRSAG